MNSSDRFKKMNTFMSSADRRRQKREVFIIAAIILFVVLLTYVEQKWIGYGADFPISNTLLMFTMTNINVLLIILLIFLVFRNLVKLLYDRKRRVMGARLRTRLVVAFISLSLIPSGVLFYFSIGFVTSSIDFWFNVPVEQALENSLHLGRHLYGFAENNNEFYLERIAYQIKTRKLIDPSRNKELNHYIQTVQRSFRIDGVEVYDHQARPVSISMGAKLENREIPPIALETLKREIPSKNVLSISDNLEFGELFRTISPIPYGGKESDKEGFVVLSVVIPQYLTENIASINRGFEEYQQIKLLKKPIQITYYLTLSIVGLLVVFCAVWFGFYLAKSISIPIKELAEGTRRVAEGDLSVRIAPVGDDEIGSLVESFNNMTHDIRVSRAQLEYSSRQLELKNAEIERRRRYMETVLDHVSTGVISMDHAGFIATINKSAENLLELDVARTVGKNYKQLLKGRHLSLAEEVIGHIRSQKIDTVEFPLRLTLHGRPRSFLLHVNLLQDDSGTDLGYVVVFDDLTELEKAQRAAAWREVARRIAHEVKNPLTPITLSAQRLERRFSRQVKDPVFDECVQMIIEHVEIIRNLVNEFSAFARFPAANPSPCDLLPIIEESLKPYGEGYPNIQFRVHCPSAIPRLNLDRRQIRQAVINLIENAIASIPGLGEIDITLNHDPIHKLVRMDIADTGSGVSDEHKIRLFEPDFSTKKTGMGLGLTIVHSIISEHHGAIRVEDNHPMGTRFVIELPV
jgi:two-component system nitrogen regulation sensor histidine kinase NtrY